MKTLRACVMVGLISVPLLAQSPAGSMRDAGTQWTAPRPAQSAELRSLVQQDARAASTVRGAGNDTCYFIRSYVFEREDGSAPVLKKQTVCTKSNANSVQRAKQQGAKFVPLSY